MGPEIGPTPDVFVAPAGPYRHGAGVRDKRCALSARTQDFGLSVLEVHQDSGDRASAVRRVGLCGSVERAAEAELERVLTEDERAGRATASAAHGRSVCSCWRVHPPATSAAD